MAFPDKEQPQFPSINMPFVDPPGIVILRSKNPALTFFNRTKAIAKREIAIFSHGVRKVQANLFPLSLAAMLGGIGLVTLDKAALENEANIAASKGHTFMDHNFAGIPFLSPSKFKIETFNADGPCEIVTAQKIVIDPPYIRVLDVDESSYKFSFNNSAVVIGRCYETKAVPDEPALPNTLRNKQTFPENKK